MSDVSPIPLVRVHWRDTRAHSAWHTADDIAAFVSEAYIVESVGWLAAESETHLAVAQSCSPHRFGDVLVIPQTAIVERWQLNEE
ncbi:MAG: hypothetical protein IPM39_15025 [Chloroflexi bacterium]|nr:hypothetical protein [Chloroflexota bacterium]